MDLRIDHVHAVATDLDASIAFYGKLGFKLLRRVEFGPDDDRYLVLPERAGWTPEAGPLLEHWK